VDGASQGRDQKAIGKGVDFDLASCFIILTVQPSDAQPFKELECLGKLLSIEPVYEDVNWRRLGRNA